ncbi:MAG TPA: biopolymer transporter TolR [Candidatus Dormibacteraeota bacterium]|nr:biopolymer transporter TolR [Candidatus Dormibacteraeota bacterium]
MNPRVLRPRTVPPGSAGVPAGESLDESGSDSPHSSHITNVTHVTFVTPATFATLALLLLLLILTLSNTSAASPVGLFESTTDIGAPALTGSATYDPAAQEYELAGAGANMWAARDEFRFVWKKMKGDFILRTRVDFVGKSAEPHRKVGWMIRSSLDFDSAYADCAEHGDGLTSLQFRRTKGATTEQVLLAVTNTDVLQLERKGGSYIFSAARYGEPFTKGEVPALDLGDEVYVGLFICSHGSNRLEKAKFRDVRIIRPAWDGLVPYRDYLGSQLEILEPQTGKLRLIHTSTEPFEAPNWTRDGKALIYNISGKGARSGRLCRFDLATKDAALLDTGPAKKNNNDHVLSFDGSLLGISDQTEGGSKVFVVPCNGGTPKRITSVAPSYLHGWSPDGKFLVYTGKRGDSFDIYRIGSDGGDEVRLTSEGMNDGSEYSPDGKDIYFNSTRSGSMQIWRMDSNGKHQEQVTKDEFNNWFPHISPDGKWIAFITFTKDVPANDHPYYKQVYLRMMPADGGTPKIIAYVYGGQGTMNVPSWSPDSTKIAFVSNTINE